ncbi:protein regulator of cytokinesis 1 isoform X1 [Ambystoma mexicanum]|uniref:protein regulator of cytokinesis 1 isoform X1 n=1 Tax=Ambystoma mexicanum TaxID=8296 RepID=UPI0037E71C6F
MRKSEVLAEESVQCLNKALHRLKDIWEEIGIPEDQRLQRTDVVRQHIKGLLDMMIAEEESLRERLLKSIAVCRKELDTLCRELVLPPFESEDDPTILQLEKDLRTRVEVLLKQKRERKSELKSLKERDQDLCDILCTPLYFIDDDTVPTLEELDHFRRHLMSLAEEKDRRRAEFVNTKKQIILCMEELDRIPDTSFERDVVCEDEESFCLSTENIAALQVLLLQLEEQRAQNESVCIQLRSRITDLWTRLQIPTDEQEAFSVHMTGSKAKTRRKLQAEVERLEELKRENMHHVIEAIRSELVSLWDKCFYSTEQRRAFAPFHDDDCTEDLLRLHDEEIMRMKDHFEVHKELFEGVQKWQESWKLFLEFEKKARDPNRFANRGGNLLKEEKQRAKLQKTLPKLEEELKVRILAWEQEQFQEFMVNGQKFMDYVSEQWQMLHIEKEREKQERLQKKNRLIEEEMHFGSTPKTPTKRKVLLAQTPGKVRKIAARTPNRMMKPPRMGPLERIKENVSQLNGTTLSGVYIHSTAAPRNLSVNSVASTYSEFARELSKASRSDTPSRILNSTTMNIQPYGL